MTRRRPTVRWVEAASGAARRRVAVEVLRGASRRATQLVLVPGHEAGIQLAREAVGSGAATGWYRHTADALAHLLAGPALAERGLAPLDGLGREALIARVVHELAARGALGRYQALAGFPGLIGALAHTLDDLRLAEVSPDALPVFLPDLSRIYRAYCDALAQHAFADRATVLRAATDAVSVSTDLRLGTPLVVLDPCATLRALAPLAVDFVAALVGRSSAAVVVASPGQETSQRRGRPIDASVLRARLEALGLSLLVERHAPRGRMSTLHEALAIDGGAAAPLISKDSPAAGASEQPPTDPGVGEVAGSEPRPLRVLCGQNEAQECAEVARAIRAAARAGVPFEQIAVGLRSPEVYRTSLLDALRRAEVPVQLQLGVPEPYPAGRAFLALLACRAEGLSARRFAEFLALGEGRDPARPPAGEPPVLASATRREPPALFCEAPGGWGTRPQRWEALLEESRVIGGEARWQRRLEALAADLRRRARQEDDEAKAAALVERADEVGALMDYALPIIERLSRLPDEARWAEWLLAFDSLAATALEAPDPVRAALRELAPMGSVGPAGLAEVQQVLSSRLTLLSRPPRRSREGAVTVGALDDLVGLEFHTVFVPGVVEQQFPRKVLEDPLLPDADRAAIGPALLRRAQRSAYERRLLALAVQAATVEVVVSYPRQESGGTRPRAPSSLALSLVRLAEGASSLGGEPLGYAGLEALARAETERQAGHPIDATEYDLDQVAALRRVGSDEEGRLRYAASGAMERALRWRYARETLERWTTFDGLRLAPGRSWGEAARRALDAHRLDRRSYSATALQKFATCPYAFYLSAVLRLQRREPVDAVDQLDALQRGSLIHEIQFETLSAWRSAGIDPTDAASREAAQGLLESVADRVVERTRDQLAPVVDRVFDDAVVALRADLRLWARRLGEGGWRPWRYELAFGLPREDGRDPESREAPVQLQNGLRLRGAIDLVEERQAPDGRRTLRVTDVKTGKSMPPRYALTNGGKVIQPVLYALALEELEPGAAVTEGRLWYCTSRADFAERVVPLEPPARAAAARVVKGIGDALIEGTLDPSPPKGGCEYCDFLALCGPGAEERASHKDYEELVALKLVRSAP